MNRWFLKLINTTFVKLFIMMIFAYRYLLSPILPSSCKYNTSCSKYAILSLQKYGFIVGSWKTIRRLISCNPFSNHYVDEDFK